MALLFKQLDYNSEYLFENLNILNVSSSKLEFDVVGDNSKRRRLKIVALFNTLLVKAPCRFIVPNSNIGKNNFILIILLFVLVQQIDL